MNPFGLLLFALGVAMVVVGFTGKQGDIIAAVVGHDTKDFAFGGGQ